MDKNQTKNVCKLIFLNETAKSQNYKGISIPILMVDKLNTSGGAIGT